MMIHQAATIFLFLVLLLFLGGAFGLSLLLFLLLILVIPDDVRLNSNGLNYSPHQLHFTLLIDSEAQGACSTFKSLKQLTPFRWSSQTVPRLELLDSSSSSSSSSSIPQGPGGGPVIQEGPLHGPS